MAIPATKAKRCAEVNCITLVIVDLHVLVNWVF